MQLHTLALFFALFVQQISELWDWDNQIHIKFSTWKGVVVLLLEGGWGVTKNKKKKQQQKKKKKKKKKKKTDKSHTKKNNKTDKSVVVFFLCVKLAVFFFFFFFFWWLLNYSQWHCIKKVPLTLTANHNSCRLLCHLLIILKVIFANNVDPEQTAPLGAVWSGSTLFACMQKTGLKSLQEYSADDKNRRQMQVFLTLAYMPYLVIKWSKV